MEKTRRIIDQCITTFLLEQVKQDPYDLTGSSSHPSTLRVDSEDILERLDNPANEHSVIQDSQTSRPAPASSSADRSLPRQIEKPSRKNEDARPRMFKGVYSTSLPGTSSAYDQDPAENTLVIRQGPLPPSPNHWSGEALDQGEHYQQRQGSYTLRKPPDTGKYTFRQLEDYIIVSFGSVECVNSSFSTARPPMSPRAASEGSNRYIPTAEINKTRPQNSSDMPELDARILLRNFAENISWRTGDAVQQIPERSTPDHKAHQHNSSHHSDLVTSKSPRIDWARVNEWYQLVLHPARTWRDKFSAIFGSHFDHSDIQTPSRRLLDVLENKIMEAQSHVRKVLLKMTESLLKRPGHLLTVPEHLRFLLILLENPLLSSHLHTTPDKPKRSPSEFQDPYHEADKLRSHETGHKQHGSSQESTAPYSGIIKRILGLLSNSPSECHHRLVAWFARYSDSQFLRTTDLIGKFVTYRLTRQHGKKREETYDVTAGLIPNMPGSIGGGSATLHTAMFVSGVRSKKSTKQQPVIYHDDWQIKAAARVMALFFSANNIGIRKSEPRLSTSDIGRSAGLAARERAHRHGQIVPTSHFYNSMLDYSDLIGDFEAWESKRSKFAFCQYPFFLSIWAKTQIMEHDARRQMEVKAREAFFDSILSHRIVNQYLFLKVRRECLIEDSLKAVSEVVATGGEEIKKGLRIEFKGEEGIDAGGLRKEWFLLLVRDVFNPEHGNSNIQGIYSSSTLTITRDVRV